MVLFFKYDQVRNIIQNVIMNLHMQDIDTVQTKIWSNQFQKKLISKM